MELLTTRGAVPVATVLVNCPETLRLLPIADPITGATRVLLVSVSVVFRPTRVSVTVGKLKVPTLTIEAIVGVVKVGDACITKTLPVPVCAPTLVVLPILEMGPLKSALVVVESLKTARSEYKLLTNVVLATLKGAVPVAMVDLKVGA